MAKRTAHGVTPTPRISPFETKEPYREMEPGTQASDMALLVCPKTAQAADPAKITKSTACQ